MKIKGLALLEVMLASILLAGLIYLVMHTMSTEHQHSAAKTIGSRLSPVMSDMLVQDFSGHADSTSVKLIQDTVVCSNTSGILTDTSTDILEGFQGSGFSLCNAQVSFGDPVVCSENECGQYCSQFGSSSSCQGKVCPSCPQYPCHWTQVDYKMYACIA
jgi:hypothetical protein